VRWQLGLLIALLLYVLALVARAFVQRARLRRRVVPARRAPRLRHPVVLAHGVLGFDEIAVAGRRHKYFRNIAAELAPLGEIVSPRLPPTASVTVRAERLVELLRDVPGDRINVIAHSMGGLDARFAISRLGLGRRVASLVTIGAPHLGTPLADLPLSRATSKILKLQALHDLTPAALERFNEEVRDVDGVAYCSVVAASNLSHTNPLLWPTHAYLSARCGPNDGLVPASSQRWGRVLREVQADHWAQVGWSLKFDAVALYEEILRELVGLGF
jgi:triacylglycerol lipase